MSVQSLNLSLWLGASTPSAAPGALVACLQSVSVSCTDDGPSGFQIQFNADRSASRSTDYSLLQNPLLQEANRALVLLTLNGQTSVLIDGIITRQELTFDAANGKASLSVTGEDLSVLMDLTEQSQPYESMSASAIVQKILGNYGSYGITAQVQASLLDQPLPAAEKILRQKCTDREYLQWLAASFGYVFCVRPDRQPGRNIAYWGPQPRSSPQPPLNVDMGPYTNVASLSFQHNALAAQAVSGTVQDAFQQTSQQIQTQGPSSASTPLATNTGTKDVRSLLRTRLLVESGGVINQAKATATGLTDTSFQQVLVAQGELDGLRYGAVLAVPGLVTLRGAGQSYDGSYYVKRVNHTIGRGQYRQSFTLTREGRGSTISKVDAS